MVKIDIVKDFSDTPGGRKKVDGPFSGEDFRERFLEKYFHNQSDSEPIEIVLDGVIGYSTSFLEEAFGGLARKYGKDKVLERLKFISDEEPLLIEEIENYINHPEGER